MVLLFFFRCFFSLSHTLFVSLFSLFLFVRFLLIFASNFFRIFFCCFVSLRLVRCERRMCKRRFFPLLPILKSEMLGYIVCTSGYQRWPLLFFLFRLFFLCVCSLLTARDVIATRTYMMPKYHSMSAQETRCVNSNMMAYFVFLSSHFSSSFWPVVFFCFIPCSLQCFGVQSKKKKR